MRNETRKIFRNISVLIPRGIRAKGRIYISDSDIIVSTNFIVLTLHTLDEAKILASWMSTIFFQLLCEVNGKQQEGMRKMEVADIESTSIPNIVTISSDEKLRIIDCVKDIDFLTLNSPIIRNIDIVWAEILYGDQSGSILLEARRLLEFLANFRNTENTND